MKRITRILMLCLAVVLAACQAEEINVPAEQTPQTLSFKATIGEQTRVSYTNDDATGNIKLAWEIGDIVKLYENNLEKATFYVSEIDGNTATFVCDESYYIENLRSTTNGTKLVYSPTKSDELVQTSNNSLEHLKYGNVISVAVPTGTDLTATGLTFAFENKSVIYKVTFPSPTYVKSGAVLHMSSSAWTDAQTLTLGYKSTESEFVAKGTDLTAYIVADGGTLAKEAEISFTLITDDGRYTYVATVSKEAGITYQPGKIYTADLNEITPSIVHLINGHEWVDLGLRLSDVDTSITSGSTADRRIVFATTNIGAENPGDIGYYFRWGELRGIKSWSFSKTPYTITLIDKDGKTETSDKDYPAVNSDERWAMTKIDGLDFQGRTDLRGLGYIYHKDADGNAYCTPAYYGDAATEFWGKGWVMMNDKVASILDAGCNNNPKKFSKTTDGAVSPHLMTITNKGTNKSVSFPLSFSLSLTSTPPSWANNLNQGFYWTSTPNGTGAYRLEIYNTYDSKNTIGCSWQNTRRKDGYTIRPIAYLPLENQPNCNTPVEWKSDITLPTAKDEFQRFDFGKHGWKLSIVSNEDEGFKVDLDAQTTEDKTITATFPKAGNVTLSFKHSVSGTGNGQYELKVYVGSDLQDTYTLGATATSASISLTGVTADTQVRWVVSTTTAPTAGTNTALISGVALSYGN